MNQHAAAAPRILHRRFIVTVAFVATAGLIAAAAASASGDFQYTFDGSSEGLSGVFITDGIPLPIDSEQTPEEAAALEAWPPFQFPPSFEALKPGSESTAYALTQAKTFVESPTPVILIEAIVSADAARTFVKSAGSLSAPLEAATDDVTVTILRLTDTSDAFYAPRQKFGSTGRLAGDTFVSIVSGSGRIDTISVVQWSAVADLIGSASAVADRGVMSLAPYTAEGTSE